MLALFVLYAGWQFLPTTGIDIMKKNLKKTLIASALAMSVFGQAQAAAFHFTGNIANHNDIVQINFSLANDATNVRVWTDSWMNGTNFDPITALWNRTTGALLFENDDDDEVNPATQTLYDSGFTLDTLAAGEYAFTVAAYDNFANGSSLSDAQFAFASQTPIPLSQWCQPANSCNMGSFWSVRLDGVDSAGNNDPGTGNNVPEPGSLVLAALGLSGLAAAARRKKA